MVIIHWVIRAVLVVWLFRIVLRFIERCWKSLNRSVGHGCEDGNGCGASEGEQ